MLDASTGEGGGAEPSACADIRCQPAHTSERDSRARGEPALGTPALSRVLAGPHSGGKEASVRATVVVGSCAVTLTVDLTCEFPVWSGGGNKQDARPTQQYGVLPIPFTTTTTLASPPGTVRLQ
jgi:hypothetical protein